MDKTDEQTDGWAGKRLTDRQAKRQTELQNRRQTYVPTKVELMFRQKEKHVQR